MAEAVTNEEMQIFSPLTLRELYVLDGLFDDMDAEVGLTDDQAILRDKLKDYYDKLRSIQ